MLRREKSLNKALLQKTNLSSYPHVLNCLQLTTSYLISAGQRRWDKLVCVTRSKCLAFLGYVTGV